MEEVKILTDKEKKKMYNTTYYTKHKTDMLIKLREKVQCPLCNKLISLSNLSRHQKGTGCINTKCADITKLMKDTIKIDKNEFQLLKDKLNELENKIKLNFP
jgi:hypothetical protein